jgi:2-keto-3-deoxy-L-arabinonate dehydratase
MNQTNNHSPAGIWPVLYAYFDEHNHLDRDAMRVQVERTIAAGAPGIVILGLATEVQRLSRSEREQIVNWANEDIASRLPLAVTVTGDTPGEQIEFGNWAAAHGAQWLILQPPATRSQPDRFYFNFFASVMNGLTSAVGAGIQNAPEYLGVGLSPEALAELALQCPNFRWLKGEGAATVLAGTIDCLREAGSTMPVFNGRGGQELLDNLRAGCVGMIVAPDSFDHQVSIYRAFESDLDNAYRLYENVLPAIVFVMQSLDALTCYGKRIAAWRMGFEVKHDRGMAPSAFGLECARRFADSLGPYAGQVDVSSS